MDTLDRYLVRDFLLYFATLLVGLTALFLGIDFLSNFFGTGLSTFFFILTYLYRIPSVMEQFLPATSLLASLFVLSNLSRQSEILALYAGGVSNWRITSTLVAAVAVLSTIGLLIFDPLIPVFNRKGYMITRSMNASQYAEMVYRPIGFWYRNDKLVYHVGQFDPKTNVLQDVSAFLRGPDGKLVEKIHAKRAHYANNEWILEDGFVVTYPIESPFPESQAFATKRGVIPDKPSDFKTLHIQESGMRLKDLRKYIERCKSYGLDATSERVRYHERVAGVFTPLIFVLLGIPFAMKPLRTQSMAKSLGYCFMVVLAYVLCSKLIIPLGKAGSLPPPIAAWGPNVVFLGLAIARLVRFKTA